MARRTVTRKTRAAAKKGRQPGALRRVAPGNGRSFPDLSRKATNKRNRQALVTHLAEIKGNRYVARMVETGGAKGEVIQREDDDSLTDMLGDLFSDIWDTLTGEGGEKDGGGDKKKKKQKIVPLEIPGGFHRVTDDQALKRSDPPNLKSKGSDKVIPKNTFVEIEDAVQKGSKQFVQVSKLPLEGAPPDGGPETDTDTEWTAASNFSDLELTPKEEGGEKVDPKDIKITLPEVEHRDDLKDRKRAAEKAGLSAEDLKTLKAAGKENIIEDLIAEDKAIKKLKAEKWAINKEKIKNKEKKAKKTAKQNEIDAHEAKKAKLRKGLSRALLARLDMKREMDKYNVDAKSWFKDLYPHATFLGKRIKPNRKAYQKLNLGGVHKELYEKLKVAEQILEKETGVPASDLHKELGVKRISGLRAPEPATGSSSGVGLHSYGLAIDISSFAGPNPYLGYHKTKSSKPIVRRATQLVRGAAFEVGMKAPRGEGKTRDEKRLDQATKMYDLLKDASEAFKIYFQFETNDTVTLPGGEKLELKKLAEAYATATGKEEKSVAEWQAQIKADHELLQETDTDFKGDPARGFIGLDKRLVQALVRAGVDWGGLITKKKDIMHFGLYRGGTIRKGRPAQL